MEGLSSILTGSLISLTTLVAMILVIPYLSDFELIDSFLISLSPRSRKVLLVKRPCDLKPRGVPLFCTDYYGYFEALF